MELHVVHTTVGGYAREDLPTSSVVGVYTDKSAAERVARAWRSTVTTLKLDETAPGILQHMKALGY